MYIPELLSPAGGLEELKAAVENGADAVYIGGKFLNARIKAKNFDDDELQEAISYAHLRKVKVYVTMNTLINQSELKKAVEYAKKLYEMSVDALIIQDFGLAAKIKEAVPQIEIHLSTQGTVYNEGGVKFAQDIGFKRVVLAREVSIDEIKKVKESTSVEVEVFAHGALCLCYSGQCQMSRAIGGRSGNKGVCAQTCRLPFKKTNAGSSCYPLSPKDLCTIDFIGELAELRVDSIKIEGRMKSADYVATVTSIYRKYLDAYKEKGTYKVSKEDRQKLLQVFNRGEFTEGYIGGVDDSELIYDYLSKHLGVYVGDVVRQIKGKNLVEIDFHESIEIGDGIEIHSEKMAGNVITYLKEIKTEGNVKRLLVGDIKGKVKPADKVYRITKKSLHQEAIESFASKSSEKKKTYRKSKLYAEFKLNLGEKAVLNMFYGEKVFEVISEELAQVPMKHPTRSESIENNLKKVGDLPFEVEVRNIENDGKSFISMAQINEMRRCALENLVDIMNRKNILGEKEKKIFDNSVDKIEKSFNISDSKEKKVELYLWDFTMLQYTKILKWIEKKSKEYPDIKFTIMIDLYKYISNYEEIEANAKNVEVMLYMIPITKGRMDEWLENNFDEIANKILNKTLSLSNVGWIERFKNEGITIYGDYGLNICNSESKRIFEEKGIEEFIPSIELLHKNNLQKLDEKTDAASLGKIPLMFTEHIFDTDRVIDRKNETYDLLKSSLGDKTVIINNMSTNDILLRADETIKRDTVQKLRVFI